MSAIVRKVSLAAILSISGLVAHAEPVWVGRFGPNLSMIPEPWQIQQLDKNVAATRYVLREWDGVQAIEAHAKKSMTLLGRTLTVDLKKTPFLCWQWRVDAPVATADMTQKSGDDYAARVYLSFTIPPEQLGFGTRAKLGLARAIYGDQVPDAAINYVWDNKHPIGTSQDNAYTDRTRMLVVRSGKQQAGAWVQERRNVAADFERAFVGVNGKLSGIAIASDTDNTGSEAHAGFADFRFVAKADDCPVSGNE